MYTFVTRSASLLKVIVPQGSFSRFLSCTNSSKSCKVSQVKVKQNVLAHSFPGSFLPVCLIRAEESLNNNKSGIFVISKWVLSLRFWSRKNLFQLCFRGVFWTSSNICTWSFFADRASNYFCKSSIIGVIKALHTPFSI